MSTSITNVYDKMRDSLVAIFVTPHVGQPTEGKYKKLQNAFIPELNDEASLRRGFGFYIGPKNRLAKNGRYEGFETSVIVVQTILKRGTGKDATINENAEKELLEDQFSLIDYFRLNTSYGAKIWDIAFESDNGQELVYSDKQNYVCIKTTFKVKHAEAC